MSSLQGSADFGRLDPEERAERRENRRMRRRRRRGRRRSRAAERHRRRADRLDERGSRRASPRRERPERAPRREARQPAEDYERPRKPGLRRRGPAPQPGPMQAHEATLQPAPESWEPPWEPPEVLDVDWEELEDEVEPEWMGAARRAQLPARWSPPAKLGRHMRLQAQQGHRAAVIELKPGLYLVAELPEQVARSEFGVAAVLAPLVVKAASKAIQHRQKTPKEQRLVYRLMHPDQAQDGQGQPLRRLFQRPDGQVQDEHGNLLQRVFHPHQAQAQAQAPQPAPQPALDNGVRALLPPPEMGWASGVVLEPGEVRRG